MTWFKIEEVAKRTKLTKRTIRYYEEVGLIDAPKRTQGGIRLYTDEDVEKIEKLVLIRDVLGFSLEELQKYMAYQKVIDQLRNEYRTAEELKAKKSTLLEIVNGIREEKKLIDEKLTRMLKFKQELDQYEERVQQALRSMDSAPAALSISLFSTILAARTQVHQQAGFSETVAIAEGVQDVFHIGAWIVVICLPLVLLLRKKQPAPASTTSLES